MKKTAKRQVRAPAPKKVAAGRSSASPRKDAHKPTKGEETPTRGLPVAPDPSRQAEAFEQAARLFHARDYAGARAAFEIAAAGPVPAMSHTARLHAKMCAQRLVQEPPKIETAEDRYNYAVSLINLRRLADAEEHLHKALEAHPQADHLYYALALTRGLQGDFEGAHRHMKRAIDLQPRNRVLARNDPDFAELIQRGWLRELLYP
jgi:tetratricopeptide (TPR) repeat protein